MGKLDAQVLGDFSHLHWGSLINSWLCHRQSILIVPCYRVKYEITISNVHDIQDIHLRTFYASLILESQQQKSKSIWFEENDIWLLVNNKTMNTPLQWKCKKSAGELWCHLVDVLELILQNSYNGPQWGIFFLSRNWKNKKHRILGIHLKNIYARFGWSKSRNKNFKTRGILHIKSI